ncbi:MAG: Persistence and stress-resistance antitoxin PasI [Betaproteobacteria bacterium ADurb.Bin341]|nr:MAG: Persistence and stress-resistance antitoxin PasI [Betaproteobacteria bacterium ADurb.Bin341]
MPEQIHIEVCYAQAEHQERILLELAPETTVEQAIVASGILSRHPEIDLGRNKVGIYAKLCKLDGGLRDGDRVEIYRPLIADPKEVRKQRAAEGKSMKKGAADAGALAAE